MRGAYLQILIHLHGMTIPLTRKKLYTTVARLYKNVPVPFKEQFCRA
jgi:hypothetical protein